MIKMMTLTVLMAGVITPMTILSSSDSSKDIRELTKRVEKLEKAAEQTTKTLDVMNKKVSEL
ncbi:MAG: hypothetical protein GXY44_01290 [Phycisphaerales bacterium]|nr:hypothetical protein [Phycisphaerales bacterium]